MEIKKRIEELKNNHTWLTLYSSQELNDLEKKTYDKTLARLNKKDKTYIANIRLHRH